MGEWIDCTLGDVITLQRGHDLPKSRMKDGNVPVAGSNGVIGWHDEYTTQAPGVTIGRSGNLGNAFYYEDNFWAHNTTLYVKDFKGNDERFVYYLLKTIDFKQFNVGSAVPTLNRNHIHPLELSIPSLLEQKAIASVLSSLDDKIDLLHRQNKTLEAMAETLFRQWFVEEADEEWEEEQITELFDVRDGTHDSPKQSVCGKYLITSRHLGFNSIDFKNAYLISEEDFVCINKRSKVSQYDILYSMIGTIGLTYLEQSLDIQYAIKNIGLFKTSQNPEWRFYTYLWLKSSLGKEFVNDYRCGSTQEYIALGSLRDIVFNKPPTEIMSKFNLLVEPIFRKIYINSLQILNIEKCRDLLLFKLMTGEIRVEV